MKTLPDNITEYKRTKVFTEKTIPKALLNFHNTKEGVWGVITVEQGQLEYQIVDTVEKYILSPQQSGIVEPTVVHKIKPLGKVLVYVIFYR